MSRAIIYENFGGPEVLELRNVPEKHAGPEQVRVRVTAIGLNPLDWSLSSRPDVAARFGITAPSGFGTDFAGVVDQVCVGAAGVAVGDRIFGGALGRAAADHVVVDTPARPPDVLVATPGGITDEVACALPTAAHTAVAAIDAIGVGPGDTVLIGGAAGGVGVFAAQLARLAGASVLGTASETTSEFLGRLGVEPVAHGPGLVDRVRVLAPGGLTAASDLFGTETVRAALTLGVPPERISTIAAGPEPPGGVIATGAADAPPDALQRTLEAILAGSLTVPIAATFPIRRIGDAVALQAGRHVHGKIVITP